MPITLSEIARQTGFSTPTVSRALRGSPLVSVGSKRKIEEAAQELGYVATPLIGAVMSSLRRSGQRTFFANIALIRMRSETSPALRFQDEMLAGARARAGELGLQLDDFTLNPNGSSLKRLQRILRSRGITGLIFTDGMVMRSSDLSDFDWADFSAVQVEYPVASPQLHVVGINHHATLLMGLRRLTDLGYRRIGLFIERHRDESLAFRWTGAFAAFQRRFALADPVPELEQPTIDRRGFLDWFVRHRPDLLVGHKAQVLDWLRECGLTAPKDLGYFSLNIFDAPFPCAGFDLNARGLGGAAVESIFSQVHQFERGLPREPKTTLIEGRWVDGPTIMAAPSRG